MLWNINHRWCAFGLGTDHLKLALLITQGYQKYYAANAWYNSNASNIWMDNYEQNGDITVSTVYFTLDIKLVTFRWLYVHICFFLHLLYVSMLFVTYRYQFYQIAFLFVCNSDKVLVFKCLENDLFSYSHQKLNCCYYCVHCVRTIGQKYPIYILPSFYDPPTNSLGN